MSVYGDMLAAFPELLQDFQLFTMKPLAGGGYTARTPLTTRVGAFIKGSRSPMKIQGESRVINEAGVFYCYEFFSDNTLKEGIYFEVDNEIFVINDNQTYSREAGFAVYGCQVVQGVTDKQVENLKVETRTIEDYPI